MAPITVVAITAREKPIGSRPWGPQLGLAVLEQTGSFLYLMGHAATG